VNKDISLSCPQNLIFNKNKKRLKTEFFNLFGPQYAWICFVKPIFDRDKKVVRVPGLFSAAML
jgi:hypothetical protein